MNGRDESPYPRPQEQIGLGSNPHFGGCAGGCFLVVLSCGMLMIASVLSIAEGPHGPNGEITGDPKLVPTIFGFGIGALILAASAIAVFAWSFGWRRKR